MNLGPDLLLGILLISIGIILWISIRSVIKESKSKDLNLINSPVNIKSDSLNLNHDPIIIIGSGGVLKSINQEAQELFEVKDNKTVDLEILANKSDPKEVFYKSCAEPGEYELLINNQEVNAFSYFLGMDSFVTLRLKSASTKDNINYDNSIIYKTIAEFSQNISASLDLNETISRIMERIYHLIPADLVEINIWDDDSTFLVPYRIQKNFNDNKVSLQHEKQKLGEGFTGLLIRSNQPIRLENMENHPSYLTILDSDKHGYKEFIGFPLTSGHEVLGTLEIYNKDSSGFLNEQYEIIEGICPTISTALNNAIIYKVENQKVSELSTLSRLSQSASYSKEPEKIFEKMLVAIEPLIPVEILGFLLFNNLTSMLEAQKPFIGLPDPFIEIFKTEIKKGSSAEKLLISQDVLITENAQVDLQWISLGFDHIARAASQKESALLPLISGGTTFGFLLASNRKNKKPQFSQAEMHLLMIVANQASPIIENMILIQQSNLKAQSAESLRKLALFASSNSNLEDILRFSIQELVSLLNADVGAFFLVDKDLTRLQLDRKSLFGNNLPNIETDFVLTNDGQYPFTITGSQKQIVVGRFDATEPLIPFYQNIYDTWEIHSLVIVPLIVRNEGIGEIWIGSKKSNFYDAGDVQTIIPAISQLAGVIEHKNLSSLTDDSLRKKVEQFSNQNRLNRELNSTLDLNKLCGVILNEVLKLSSAKSSLIAAYDLATDPGKPIIAVCSTGGSCDHILSQKEKEILTLGKYKVIEDNKEILSMGFSQEINSLVIFPFPMTQKIKVALYLINMAISGSSREIIDNVQSYIHSATNPFENALNYHQKEQQIINLNQKIELQQRIFSISSLNLDDFQTESNICNLFDEIRNFINLSFLKIYDFDMGKQEYRTLCIRGICEGCIEQLVSSNIPWENVELLITPKNLINGFYQIACPNTVAINSLEENVSQNGTQYFLYPLVSRNGEPAGLVSLETRDFDVRNEDLCEVLELFMVRINTFFENRHTPLQTELSIQEKNPLKSEIIESSEFSQEGEGDKSNFELHDFLLDDELIRSLMTAKDYQNVLLIITQTIISNLHYPSAILFEKNSIGEIQVIEKVNTDLDTLRIATLMGQKNPNDVVFKSGKLLQGSILEDGDEWFLSPLVRELHAQSFLAIPIKNLENIQVVVFVFSTEVRQKFTVDQLETINKRVNLVNSIINRQRSLGFEVKELNDYQQRIEFIQTLNDQDIIDLSRTLLTKSIKIVPAAQAGWVGLWNEITQKIDPLYSSGYKNPQSILEINYSDSNWSIPQVVFENNSPLSINDINFASNYPLSQKDLLLYQKATGGLLPIGNMLVPISQNDKTFGIIVLENFSLSEKFENKNVEDVCLLVKLSAPFFDKAIKIEKYEKTVDDLMQKQDQSNLLKITNSSLFSNQDLRNSIRRTLNQLLHGFVAEVGVIYITDLDPFIEIEENLVDKNYLDVFAFSKKIREISTWLNINPDITIINETYNNESWVSKFSQDLPFASLISTPLICYGQTLGTMFFANTEPFSFNDSHKEILDSIIPPINFVINNLIVSEKHADQSQQLVNLTLEKQSIESQSTAVLNSFSDAIIMTDSNGKIKFINLAAEKNLDIQAEEIVNKQISVFEQKFQGKLKNWINSINVWTNNAIILNLDQSLSEKIEFTDQRMLSLYSAPIIWQTQFLGTLSIFRDITLEAQIDRTKSEFITNVSHELRTPLTSIKGYADILLMGAAGNIPEQQKRFIDIIKSNAIRLTTLVDDLLNISKIESRQTDFYDNAVYIEKIITQVVKEFQALAESEAKQIKFDIRIPKNIKPVRGDESRLVKIFQTLLNNSYHYSIAPVNILIRISQTPNETQIDVQDFGIGIKKDFQNHILERFFRGEEELVLATPGTGLGLSVAKSLVELQGGQIWFFSSGINGEGSTFSFTIPVFSEG
ncbi:MAG: GAF domain-containing protein [Anaerolineaceae bacterium]